MKRYSLSLITRDMQAYKSIDQKQKFTCIGQGVIEVNTHCW